ncbi:hypothetical protein Dimus_033122 [Dionaea muscipula]
MGIQGLLPLVKSIMAPIHIKELQGCCVAVDTYSWLHKGALSCSRELCKGLPTSRHVDYCMHRVNLLRHYGVKPILVFDGGLLPMKGEQENKRARARKENLARAIEHESNGNSTAAYECYQKAVDISPAAAYDLIQVLKQEHVYYIVAPYEADAQMTFLAINKLVDAVITEDSDLIPFGCPRIIFKMDKFGQGVEFRYHMLPQNKELNFAGFTKQMLLEMCILSGCDYLQSLPGMGLKKAHALISKFKSFDKVIKHLAFTGIAVPPLYEESFKKAILTFHHQRVYDPNVGDTVNLLDLPDNIEEDLEFLGPAMPQLVAKAIAEGMVDPITKQPFQGEIVHSGAAADSHYELQDFRTENKKKKLELPAQRNVLTNYFCFASLEAKRRFKAPRTTAKHPDTGSSPRSGENIWEGALAREINSSSTSIASDSGVGLLQENDAVLDSSFDDTEGSQEKAPLQQSRHSIHKPCLLLQKERRQKHTLLAVTEKTTSEAEKVTLRSSYFLHNSGDENDPSLENGKVIIRSSYFRQKPRDEDGARSKCEKAALRSSYFKRKSVAVNDSDGNIDGQQENDPSPFNSISDITRSVSAEAGNNGYEDSNLKSKASLADSAAEVDVTSTRSRTEASVPGGGSCLAVDDPSSEQKSEDAKFGCNISHLSHYSEISEKSLENFVSVISSFNFSSSGSRASGLRAPLRDVRNTCSRRQTAASDISQFSYVPTNKKASAAISRKTKTLS